MAFKLNLNEYHMRYEDKVEFYVVNLRAFTFC